MEKRLNMRLFATASLPTLRPSRPRTAETNSGDSRLGQDFSLARGLKELYPLRGIWTTGMTTQVIYLILGKALMCRAFEGGTPRIALDRLDNLLGHGLIKRLRH